MDYIYPYVLLLMHIAMKVLAFLYYKRSRSIYILDHIYSHVCLYFDAYRKESLAIS